MRIPEYSGPGIGALSSVCVCVCVCVYEEKTNVQYNSS